MACTTIYILKFDCILQYLKIRIQTTKLPKLIKTSRLSPLLTPPIDESVLTLHSPVVVLTTTMVSNDRKEIAFINTAYRVLYIQVQGHVYLGLLLNIRADF